MANAINWTLRLCHTSTPEGVGEAVGYAHGRGHAGRGLRRFAKNPHTSGSLLAVNRWWCALLPAGGHRSLVGLCAAGGGPQWKASHGRGGVGGGQARGPLPWPASGRCCSSCWKAPQCTLRLLLRQGPGARALPMAAPWVPASTPAPFAWASPRSRKNKTCSDQPLHGQRSVAHVFAHPLFGGHGKPSHPCVSLQHTALRNIPWNRHAFFVLKPHTTGRQP
jgi:hypothetical protein